MITKRWVDTIRFVEKRNHKHLVALRILYVPFVCCFAFVFRKPRAQFLCCTFDEKATRRIENTNILNDHPTHKHILHVFLTKTNKMHRQQLKKRKMLLTSIRNRIQPTKNQKKTTEKQEERIRCLMCNKLNNCLHRMPVWVWKCEHKRFFCRTKKKQLRAVHRLRLYGTVFLMLSSISTCEWLLAAARSMCLCTRSIMKGDCIACAAERMRTKISYDERIRIASLFSSYFALMNSDLSSEINRAASMWFALIPMHRHFW